MIRFYKIKFEQYKDEVEDNLEGYNNFIIPKKENMYSADYYFYAPYDITLKAYDMMLIPTCAYVLLKPHERLLLFPLKNSKIYRDVRCATLAEISRILKIERTRTRHIFVRIENITNKDVFFKKGEAICTGTFGKMIKLDDVSKIDLRAYDKI